MLSLIAPCPDCGRYHDDETPCPVCAGLLQAPRQASEPVRDLTRPGDIALCSACLVWLIEHQPTNTWHVLSNRDWMALPIEMRRELTRDREAAALEAATKAARP